VAVKLGHTRQFSGGTLRITTFLTDSWGWLVGFADLGFNVDGGGAAYCDMVHQGATVDVGGSSRLLRLAWNCLDMSGDDLRMPVVQGILTRHMLA
jgi:hypothetical protein